MNQATIEYYRRQNSFWNIIDIKSFISSIFESNIELEELATLISTYVLQNEMETINFIYKKLDSI